MHADTLKRNVRRYLTTEDENAKKISRTGKQTRSMHTHVEMEIIQHIIHINNQCNHPTTKMRINIQYKIYAAEIYCGTFAQRLRFIFVIIVLYI